LSIDDYIKGRYNEQVKWYDNQSIFNKRLNYGFQIPTIIFSAIIPVFAILEQKWITVILSAIVAILIGISNYFKFEEKWHNYRNTCEILRKELYYYQFKINDYKNSTSPEELFVQKVEAIISTEHTKWQAIEKTEKKYTK